MGLIAAALLIATVVLAFAGQAARAASARDAKGTAVTRHYCAATDRDFIDVARLNLESVGLFGDDYLQGSAGASDVISASNDAATQVNQTSPFDPSLKQARRYMHAMFLAYARAVHQRANHGNPAQQMYRAYTLGEEAHQVLAAAQAPLAKLGCDVSDLL